MITGDLTIIDNHKLKDLILKGPKYREPTKVNWVKNKSMIFDSVDLYAKKWAKREREDLSLLSLWKDKVKSIIETRISKLERNFKQPKHKVLENHSVKECLKQLHEKFVFVPADKAGNNVILCRNPAVLAGYRKCAVSLTITETDVPREIREGINNANG